MNELSPELQQEVIECNKVNSKEVASMISKLVNLSCLYKMVGDNKLCDEITESVRILDKVRERICQLGIK
jgi:hypothetical protein